ncbi:YlmH/Sll1252 family protein [Cellulosilyticum sp. I15G10I2]|uniref:YlmH/Sll1252 family protein n=1 Tax=Cellulosilyticum sp. I15G10I2 TaxID=1892843 RepID=UPI00085C5856|nr:YlmH/Sll1252 family protein [Cellulosilyticum sp. I15G10I2]
MKKPLHEIKDPKEKLFINILLEYSRKREVQKRAFFTEFYNVEWMKQVIQKHVGLTNMFAYQFFGGYEHAERQVLGFFPTYDTNFVFPIGCLKIIVKTGIGKALSHRDFLGALLGLGLERDIIGDIIIKPFGAYLIIKKSMIDYITCTLTSIGKYQNIELVEVSFSELELSVGSPQVKEINTTVASLRVDSVASVGFGISRTSCTKLIQNDKAKCNGILISPQHFLKEGDIITLRGYGKIKLKQVNGTTKKDRLHICIEKYI